MLTTTVPLNSQAKLQFTVFLFCLLLTCSLQAQQVWVDDEVTITKLDSLEGYEVLKGTFMIENTSVYEVMNLILDVDSYEWVEGESKTKMLKVDESDSSFTFDFFVNIPWLFVKKTGRVKVDVLYKDGVLMTKSTLVKDYDRDEDYDPVDFYCAQWKLQQADNNVRVSYTGVYQDVKMVLNLNNIIINKIRKRLNSTSHNLIALTANKHQPAATLVWPER